MTVEEELDGFLAYQNRRWLWCVMAPSARRTPFQTIANHVRWSLAHEPEHHVLRI